MIDVEDDVVVEIEIEPSILLFDDKDIVWGDVVADKLGEIIDGLEDLWLVLLLDLGISPTNEATNSSIAFRSFIRGELEFKRASSFLCASRRAFLRSSLLRLSSANFFLFLSNSSFL